MIALKVFFAFLVVLFLSRQGYAIDSYCNINVRASETGRFVKGSPEFEVVLYNTCACNQYNVVVSCDGLNSIVPLKPEVLRIVEGGCFVNDGQSIPYSDPFKFKYAGTLPTTVFAPVSSSVACS